MEKRSNRNQKGPVLQVARKSIRFFKNYRQWSNRTVIVVLLIVVAISMALTLLAQGLKGVPLTSSSTTVVSQTTDSKDKTTATEQETSARIMANGDLLYHIPIYRTALKEDGTYDFHENFEYVKPWLKQADLVIGDFEGTVNKDHYLGGYPLFNAPGEVMGAIKDAGYQVLDLAHNHLLAYSYGFNGIEEYISKEDYDNHLSDLNEEKMKAEIERAEKEADITVIMPQMGIEYQLEPTEEQKQLYHKMIDWGADIIFGGHPHVVEPAETVEKDGDKKLIIYSMGNFISNQRIETMQDEENAKWTERGVLMDVTIKKKSGKTTIETAKAHPTWVNRTPKGTYSPEGYPLYLYQTYILDEFIEGGKYRDQLDEATKERIDTAYKEMNEHVGLKW